MAMVKPRDHEYLLKYGIQPGVWGGRMVKAYEDPKVLKLKPGGYHRKLWGSYYLESYQ